MMSDTQNDKTSSGSSGGSNSSKNDPTPIPNPLPNDPEANGGDRPDDGHEYTVDELNPLDLISVDDYKKS